ncbi:MAG: PRC-barrel domain-containing protein [Thermoplasmata archaeon]|jgi:sporulation protein YlmC with PRC-barrel domain|nr:PRC-barrel domain protein [Thermoplasmatales archaeon]PMP73898.1 MAG: PRC-barrel domain protein [Aciduliprofundum sp.]HEU13063.1 PRC-barrel domain protein [Euryarchaeota archaeon]
MKKFITELRGKTVMTSDGMILGTIDNLVIDTDTGNVQHLLVIPSEDLPNVNFEADAQGRLILPFKGMKSVKDVVVLELK